MKVSRTWLQRYFATELPNSSVLADALTFHAFEIESVEGDVLEVKVLPDRAGYGLSHRGIATELSAILKLPLVKDPLKTALASWPTSRELELDADPRYVLRHTGVLLKGVTVGPSPLWLQEILMSIGQRSINNVVDATNFVMYNVGQPTHAFDAGKITRKDGKLLIRIREAHDKEAVELLSGETCVLGKGMYVFAEKEVGAALDIAGIKGGLHSGVTHETRDVFLSAGNYDGEIVRKTAQALGIMTDASQRFQNRPSPELTAYGMRDLVMLIQELAGGDVEGVHEVYHHKPAEYTVSVTLEKVSRLLGASYTDTAVRDVFERLGLPFEARDGVYVVTPPFERTDLRISEDLVEEVGRIIGYDYILPREVQLHHETALPQKVAAVEAIKNLLVEEGYIEVSTYALLDEGDLELQKPLADDKKFLRTSLARGHHQAVVRNQNLLPLFNLSDVRLFEIGRVWPKGEEKSVLGVTYWYGGKQAEKKEREIFSTIQKKLQELLGVEVEGRKEGSTLEFDLEVLLAHARPQTVQLDHTLTGQYRPFSSYPFALRDVAVWTPEGTSATEVEEIVRSQAGDLLYRIDLFDSFTKEGKTSYAFHLVLLAEDRTLTEGELAACMERITKTLNEKPGFQVR